MTNRSQQCIRDAIRQTAPPAFPQSPSYTAGRVLAAMRLRLHQAHEPIAGCLPVGRALLETMKDDGVQVALNTSPADEVKMSRCPIPQASQPLINSFADRGGKGLRWTTCIPAGHFEHADVDGSASEWWELCDTRLAVSVNAHFDMIENSLGELDKAGPLDAPARRLCLAYNDLRNGTHGAVLNWATDDIRPPDKFVSYLQVHTFWHP